MNGMIDLKRLEELNQRVTKGPWFVMDSSSVVAAHIPKGGYQTTGVAYAGDEMRHSGGLCYGDERDANAALIAESKNALPAMIEAVRCLDWLDERFQYGLQDCDVDIVREKIRAVLAPFMEGK